MLVKKGVFLNVKGRSSARSERDKRKGDGFGSGCDCMNRLSQRPNCNYGYSFPGEAAMLLENKSTARFETVAGKKWEKTNTYKWRVNSKKKKTKNEKKKKTKFFLYLLGYGHLDTHRRKMATRQTKTHYELIHLSWNVVRQPNFISLEGR